MTHWHYKYATFSLQQAVLYWNILPSHHLAAHTHAVWDKAVYHHCSCRKLWPAVVYEVTISFHSRHSSRHSSLHTSVEGRFFRYASSWAHQLTG